MSSQTSTIYLGNKLEGYKIAPKNEQYTKVILYNGGKNEDGSSTYFSAGDDSGLVLEMDCAWATEEMAIDILNSIGGILFQPFSATNALLDPAAEIGDSIKTAGITSAIFQRTIYMDSLYSADIASIMPDEDDDEYPYIDNGVKQFERINSEIATVKSSLIVQADYIQSEVIRIDTDVEGVTGRITTAESLIRQNAESITSTVSLIDSTNGEVNKVKSTIEQLANKVSVVVTGDNQVDTEVIIGAINDDYSGIKIRADIVDISTDQYVTFTNLSEKGQTIINGSNIVTGILDADRVAVKDAFHVLRDTGEVDANKDPILVSSGWMGAATGSAFIPEWNSRTGQYDYIQRDTYGVAMSTGDTKITASTTDPYVIVTTEGVRMSCNGNGIVVTRNGVFWKLNGGSWTPMGTAVFG